MRADILKILEDASNTECIYREDFLHVADEIQKLYQPKKEENTKNKDIKKIIEEKLDILLEGNYLVSSSDKSEFLSVITQKIKELIRSNSIKFFYWWLNTKCNDTEQGFDKWWENDNE